MCGYNFEKISENETLKIERALLLPSTKLSGMQEGSGQQEIPLEEVSVVLPRRILICPSDWLCGNAFLPLTLA